MRQTKLYQAKAFLITFPQCPATKEELLDHLKGLWVDVTYAVVSKEKHADGSPHLHAVLRYNTRKCVYRQDWFDYGEYHPNVQCARNVNAAITYVKKDGDFIEHGGHSETLYEMAESMESRQDFFTHCLDHKIPFTYAKDAWDSRNGIDEAESITFYEDPNLDLALTWPEQLSMS